MRILYVTSSLPFGSSEAFIIPEVEELQRQGHIVAVVPTYPRGKVVHEGAERLIDRQFVQPLISWSICFGALRQFICKPTRSLRALWLIMTWRPQHLLKNLSVYAKGLWLAWVALSWRAEHIHAHWAATSATLAMVASEVSGIPWSFTAHRWDVVDDNLLRRKAVHASFARFISESGFWIGLEKGVPSHKAFVLHMGVNVPGRTSVESRPSRSDSRPFRILCPASFVPVKGHKYLLEAMALVSQKEDVELWLAGDGPLKNAVEAQAAELGLRGIVRFLGLVAHERLLRLYEYGQIDAVVLPSVDLGGGLHEGIPVALMEAMAYGLPVVSTRTGGIPELLEHDAGILVPPKDPQALAAAILRLVNDRETAMELGKKARKRICEAFAVEAIVKQLANHFEIRRVNCQEFCLVKSDTRQA